MSTFIKIWLLRGEQTISEDEKEELIIDIVKTQFKWQQKVDRKALIESSGWYAKKL